MLQACNSILQKYPLYDTYILFFYDNWTWSSKILLHVSALLLLLFSYISFQLFLSTHLIQLVLCISRDYHIILLVIIQTHWIWFQIYKVEIGYRQLQLNQSSTETFLVSEPCWSSFLWRVSLEAMRSTQSISSMLEVGTFSYPKI